MQPSRRNLLGYCGVVAAAAVAGCTDTESDDDPVADNAPIRVTLTIDETRTLFESQHVDIVGPVEMNQNGMSYLTLQLTDEGVEAATETASAADLAERYEDAEIAVIVDGEALNRFGVEQTLATSIADDEWDGAFRMTFEDEESADSFRETLVTGSA